MAHAKTGERERAIESDDIRLIFIFILNSPMFAIAVAWLHSRLLLLLLLLL